MVLVFIFIIIILLIFICFISTLKINIKYLEISNEIPDTPLIKDLKISIGIYAFGKIKIFTNIINRKKIENIKKSSKFEKIKDKIIAKNKSKVNKDEIKKNLNILKQVNPKLEQINLELKLGTEDVVLTSFFIVIISILISMLLTKTIEQYDEEKYKYKIIPNYNNQNSVKIILSGIIEIKLVNIINIIFRLLFRSDESYERTSNRRAYDNCDEQYTRNGRCKYNNRRPN